MNRSANQILCIVISLVGFGLVMIYSVGSGRQGEHPEACYGAVIKHSVCIAIGLGALLAMALCDYHRLVKAWWLAMLAAYALLTLVLIFGVERNNARRWFAVWGPICFQPSEVAKIAVPLFLAFFVGKVGQSGMRSFFRGLVLGMGLVCGLCLLILKEPDYGTTVLIATVAFTTLFVYGLNLWYTLLAAGLGALGLVAVAMSVGYMRSRITCWLDPWADPLGKGYHITQSLIAIGSGGVLGKGLGWSQQKLGYLPEANTDFIFSIIAEEFGLIGGVALILLFMLLLREGIRVARRAPDVSGSVLAFAITLTVTLQAALNIAVTTNCVPTKGIALPFISFGGSSLVFSMAAMGILINIARHTVTPAVQPVELQAPASA